MRLFFPAAAALILAGCNKEPPPKKLDEKPATTPVPSDIVFNDFLPQGGGGQGLAVRMDGGLEGGLAAVEAAAGGGDGGAGGGTEPAAEGALHVTDPGAEPRTVRKYAFTANRADKRTITSRESANTPDGPQEQAIAITVEITPKQVKPAGAHMALKLLGVDIPGAQGAEKAAVAQQFGAFNGLTAEFDMASTGEVSELELKGDEKMQANPKMAQVVVSKIQQSLEMLEAVFPATPIGIGAKWEGREDRNQGGVHATQTRSFVLKDVAADGTATVQSTITADVPKTALPQRPGAPQGTISVSLKGTYTYQGKLDHIASKVDGEATTAQNVELKGKPPISQVAKSKVTLEPAK
jgi:hypothetical protein